MPAGAAKTARAIAGGRTTSEEAVASCLARIAGRDETVRAWAWLDPDQALAEARARDAAARPLGPLHGVPVGIKDIFDTADMPTQMGSPIYQGHRPAADAASVAILRAAGAVILGKTVTAEFAGTHPGPTANPHDVARTPGGSSQGSAAGVADFMVPVALGTQTGGSVLRPSSFCGIVGFKPSFGTFNRAGIKSAAESFDTIGLHARTLEDVALLCDVLTGREPGGIAALARPPRIGICRTPLWHLAQPETVAAIDETAEAAGAAGAAVDEVALPAAFDALADARRAINDYERARAMAHEWRTDRDRLSPAMQKTVEAGLAIPYAVYRAARARTPGLPAFARLAVRPMGRAARPGGQRRGADRARLCRRSRLPGAVDDAARPGDRAAHPSRPERHAGRHPAGRPPRRRRPPALGRRVGVGAVRRGRVRRVPRYGASRLLGMRKILAQLAKRRHGLAIAASRHALGDG